MGLGQSFTALHVCHRPDVARESKRAFRDLESEHARPRAPPTRIFRRWFRSPRRTGRCRDPPPHRCARRPAHTGTVGACAPTLTDRDAGVGVRRLHQLLALVADDPVGVDLSGALGVQVDHLEVPEVGLADGAVLRAHVVDIRHAVVVEVVFTRISSPVTCHQGRVEKQGSRRRLAGPFVSEETQRNGPHAACSAELCRAARPRPSPGGHLTSARAQDGCGTRVTFRLFPHTQSRVCHHLSRGPRLPCPRYLKRRPH